MTAASDGAEALLRALPAAAGMAGESIIFKELSHGNSGDLVVRISAPVDAVAKLADPRRRVSVDALAREVAALDWLDGRGGAPRLIWSGEVLGRPAMLAAALPGAALHGLPDGEAEAGLVAAISALKALHALPTADCPFDERLAVKLTETRRRLDAGETGRGDWDPEGTGAPAEALWAKMAALAPAEEDLVVTHGDASLPNFIVDGARAGPVDLGRLGVADRWCDLALFLRSAARNFPGVDARALLRTHYPIAIDEQKLIFYQLLDRFS